MAPPLSGPAGESLDREYAARKVVQGWLEITGPTTATALAAMLGLPRNLVGQALISLEVSGVVLRGEFTGCAGETEWCERVLLARIHRLTLGELRREIEPVTAADFMRFLFARSEEHTSELQSRL